jgi:Cupin-like domain
VQDDDDDDDGDVVDDENAGFEPLNMLRKMIDSEDEDSDDNGQDNGADDYVDSDEEDNQPSTSVITGRTTASRYSAVNKNKGNDAGKTQEISVTNASSHSLAGPSTSIKSPPNFSKVETSLPLDELAQKYPLYYEALTSSRSNTRSEKANSPRSSASASSSSSSNSVSQSTSDDNTLSSNSNTVDSNGNKARCFEVTITAGQMLYIPAGWFHEVRSTGGGSEGHMALNYWFHPPDGTSFEKPYSSNFWPADWEKRNV